MFQKLTTHAHTALGAFEALPLGEPHRSAHEAATTAIRALSDAARPALFPGPEPIGADTWADLNSHLDVVPTGPGFGRALVVIHGEALVSHPKLARAIRGAAVRGRLGDALGAFEWAVAAQLADTEEAARVFVEAAAMLVQADAIKERHEAHNRAAVEAIARSERAAAAAIADAAKEHRASMAQFFIGRGTTVFQLGGRSFTGQNIAAMLKGELSRDTDGYTARDLNITGTPSIDAIEKAMRQRLAFEAAA